MTNLPQTEANIARMHEAAYEAGKDHGLNAGTWVIDGDTSDESVRRLAQGIEDGDPEIMDSLPSSPLSGEFAGDPTPQTLFADLGMSGDEDYADDVLTQYELGFSDGVGESVQESISARLF